jgi:hypothetical protein
MAASRTPSIALHTSLLRTRTDRSAPPRRNVHSSALIDNA